MLQSTAIDILKSGENVFLTGPPGTGKTHTLTDFISLLRMHEVPIAITASTGIAASHIKGSTLHSFAGLGIGNITVDEKFLKNITKNRRIVSRIIRTKVLIIDEISMVPPDVFTAVDHIMRHVRMSQSPFGGVQLVVSGDFFQLPPIQRAREQREDAHRYAWQTNSWEESNFQTCYLHERHRHTDNAFIAILDEIRASDVSEESRELLTACAEQDIDEKRITRLYTHNRDVDVINMRELQKLQTQGKRYNAQSTGREPVIESILGSSLITSSLILKKNSLVMFVRNDRDGRYVNGTLGTVTSFDPTTSFPIVETYDGQFICVRPEEWSRENDAGTVVASVRQLPLRLAWALTVHKSQGMTLDAAEIDLSQCFEVGQGYVALSRVRSLDGLRLLGANDIALMVDDAVQDFDKLSREQSERDTQESDAIDQDTKESNWKSLIIERGGVLNPQKLTSATTSQKKSKTPTHQKTKELLDIGDTIDVIADKRSLKIGTIVSHIAKLRDENYTVDRKISSLSDDIIEDILDIAHRLSAETDKDHFLADGSLRLSAIWESSGKKYSYDEIHQALLFL